ncbi:MAG: hypothetical protein GXZ16_03650, partial [Spirochaetales bacterium]|nr:hypothetical protein [Spirochaetales bacterium]
MKRFSKGISFIFLIVMLVISLVGCATTKQPAEVKEAVKETVQQVPEVKEEVPVTPVAEKPEPAAPVAETKPVAPEVKPLEYSFDIYGYRVDIKAFDGYADVTYPAFVTDKEVAAAAQAAMQAYPQYLAGVTYKITGPGKLTVNFMKGLTKADADYIVDLLKSNLKWYIEQMFAAPAPVAPAEP